MKATEIRVTIDSVEKQQRAIEILERYREIIMNEEWAMKFNDEFKHLYFNTFTSTWYISCYSDSLTEITLDELEEMLKNEK